MSFVCQKSVDGGSKWRAGTMVTEVRLDGWCEGGLRQQINDGGGCASMRERSERVESPGTYVTWRGVGCCYMMRLAQTTKMAQLLKIKAYVKYMGCM